MRIPPANALSLATLPFLFLPLHSCQTTAAPSGQDGQAETTPEQAAQEEDSAPKAVAAEPSYWHVPIGWNNTGLSFGNSERWRGLRINVRDHGVERIDGLNLTLWSPRKPAVQELNGMSIGLRPGVRQGQGVSVGLAASIGEESLTGVQIGGLATVSKGTLTGASVGGLAVVSDGLMRGVSVAGLAIVSEGGSKGINLAGLASVSEGAQSGINAAGLAVVSEGRQRGIQLAGLACVTESDIQGLSIAGLATVAGKDLHGVGISGLATVFEGELRGIGIAGLAVGGSGSEGFNLMPNQRPNTERDTSAEGLMIAGYRVQANRVKGISAALIMTRSHDMTGLAIGAYNGISGKQEGLSIGLFNHATELKGVQIGLLNYVGDNPKWLRWLPLVNAHF